MKYLLYAMFSMVEYSSLFILMLALFRFRIREYIREILIASISNAIIASILGFVGLSGIALIFQIVAVFITILIIFKEKMKKALWMISCGYALFIAIQTIELLIINFYKLIDLTNIDEYSLTTHVLQVVTTLIIYLVSYIIRASNDGIAISFHKRIFKSSYKIFFGSSVGILLTLVTLVFMFFSQKSLVYFSIVSLIAIISIVVLLFISKKQERNQFSSVGNINKDL